VLYSIRQTSSISGLFISSLEKLWKSSSTTSGRGLVHDQRSVIGFSDNHAYRYQILHLIPSAFLEWCHLPQQEFWVDKPSTVISLTKTHHLWVILLLWHWTVKTLHFTPRWWSDF
jgi:hypothetical protein